MALRLNIFKREEFIEDINLKIKEISNNSEFSLGENFDGYKIEKIYPIVMATKVFYCKFTDTFNKCYPVESTPDDEIMDKLEGIL